MQQALELAIASANDNEIPIGCIIVDADGAIIGRGRNRRESTHNALAHAELEAINAACNALGAWRLEGCTAYVTLEPCMMCRGAFQAARIQRVIYGAGNINPRAVGAEPLYIPGILADACSEVLTEFFKKLRG